MNIHNSDENYIRYRSVDFHVLRVGEEFIYKNKKYKKTNEDGAIKIGYKKFHPFWPQISVKMLKSYTLKEMVDKYPELEYSY